MDQGGRSTFLPDIPFTTYEWTLRQVLTLNRSGCLPVYFQSGSILQAHPMAGPEVICAPFRFNWLSLLLKLALQDTSVDRTETRSAGGRSRLGGTIVSSLGAEALQAQGTNQILQVQAQIEK